MNGASFDITFYVPIEHDAEAALAWARDQLFASVMDHDQWSFAEIDNDGECWVITYTRDF